MLPGKLQLWSHGHWLYSGFLTCTDDDHDEEVGDGGGMDDDLLLTKVQCQWNEFQKFLDCNKKCIQSCTTQALTVDKAGLFFSLYQDDDEMDNACIQTDDDQENQLQQDDHDEDADDEDDEGNAYTELS